MTSNQPIPDGEDKPFDPVTETREWAAAVSEANCQRIAKRKGKRIVQMINTGNEPLPIICIFEDYPDE